MGVQPVLPAGLDVSWGQGMGPGGAGRPWSQGRRRRPRRCQVRVQVRWSAGGVERAAEWTADTWTQARDWVESYEGVIDPEWREWRARVPIAQRPSGVLYRCLCSLQEADGGVLWVYLRPVVTPGG